MGIFNDLHRRRVLLELRQLYGAEEPKAEPSPRVRGKLGGSEGGGGSVEPDATKRAGKVKNADDCCQHARC